MRCPGKNISINFGTWFYPINSKPSECTICEYCVKNGCVDKSTMQKINYTILDYVTYIFTKKQKLISCDCDNKLRHAVMMPLLCPYCEVKFSDYSCTSTCGICKRCHQEISLESNTYCTGCSFFLNSCYSCGEEITHGNIYIDQIKKLTGNNIEMWHYRMGSHNNITDINHSKSCDKCQHYEDKINSSIINLRRILNTYKDKSREQVIDIITKNSDNVIDLNVLL